MGMVAVTMAMAGCAEPSQAQTAEPWVLKGRVVDEQGRPVARAKILADNELLYNSYASGTTGADGRYRIVLPRIHVTWNASGKAVRTVAGEKIETDLAPDDEDSFAGNQGAVRNFTLRTSGMKADGTGSYGASVVVYTPIMSGIDPLQVQLRFEPLDGGAPFAGTPVSTGDGPAVKGVAVNRYRISATLGGRPLGIRVRNQGAYGRFVEPQFTKIMSSLYELSLEVK
ncbi:MAG: carboxypeptidase-like regulatory domain-containing protein [Sphingomonas sp.]|nr:carboxypeptidase-like regulatory domain-containing protein [Sphingomonas sp.]MCX8476637.1 carboxypeptidase-like regulatory domain-containing protein [Sphingomonas sp.]